MAEYENEEFKFPDEKEEKAEVELEVKGDAEFEIEIEDDTPEEDRNRQPMPKEIVEKLEKDELEQYGDEAKEKLKQLRKVWHDERREKEAALREQQEAINAAKRLHEENKRMKDLISNGEKEYLAAMNHSAQLQLEMAKKAYKDAYDMGDSDQIIEAQQAVTQATMQMDRIKNFKMPPLQEEKFEVQTQYEQPKQQAPRPDDKVMAWQERNPWFGQDEEMTASALGLHEKLKRQGVVVGSDEYYSALDKTMRKRFPEEFGEEEVVKPREEAPKAKPSTVVAPATRSTASKKVKLKPSQVAIAKKLGLTPEQYVRELLKMEA